MDIFGRKRIAKLEEEVRRLKGVESENDRLRREITNVENDLSEALKLRKTIPEDCIPGEYCEACEFVKEYEKRYYVSGYTLSRCHDRYVTGYVCNRANVCKNFVQKKVEE